jgi:uncharacterized RDD family membrane protein YckC
MFYYVLQWKETGQTIGKAKKGLVIIDSRGLPLTWRQSFLRFVGYVAGMLAFGLGFIWIGLDSKQRGWHDYLAGTYVVSAEQTDAYDIPEKRTRKRIYRFFVGLLMVSVAICVILGVIGIIISIFLQRLLFGS